MKYHGIVRPDEMKDAKEWLAQMLKSLRQNSSEEIKPEIKLVRQGWGRLKFNCSVDWPVLRLNGKIHKTGLGTHTDSVIEVKLPRPGKRLVGLAGIDDNDYTRKHSKAIQFSVMAGARTLWKSGPRTVDMPPAPVDVSLAGRSEFTLLASGDTNGGHADWADLKIVLEDGSSILIDSPNTQNDYFSFNYGGRSSRDILETWRLEESKPLNLEDVTVYQVTRTDKATGLKVAVEIKAYRKFPALEWIVRFKNTGKKDTPILDSIKSIDVAFPPEAVLHYHTGDYCARDGYEPHSAVLSPGAELKFAPDGGRPTDKAWPYYNMEYPKEDKGVILVVGWSGQWASQFKGENDDVRVVAGQELTHFKLHPGEEARTPISVLMFWRGDRMRSQNMWRRWMMACNMPRPGGKLPPPMLPAYTGRWFEELAKATTETQIGFIDRYLEEGIKPDYWWMDAGWYPCGEGWWNTGTWEPDAKRFPKGLREICDYCHSKDMNTLLWFEPERANKGTWLWEKHPEWLLGSPVGSSRLLNLGNPDALKWVIEHISGQIVKQGIDLYRQDFNMPPLDCWRSADAPDRQGITEMRHVEGYLAFWKELRRRFPSMLIDSCASGGRRNDLETMRLSVPFHKTDYDYADNATKQAFHHTLALWFPYFGAYVLPVDDVDTYAFRSSIAPMTLLTYDMRRRDVEWKKLKKLCEEWRKVVATEYFYGDYYPITKFNNDEDLWIAWQFHRSDTGTGIVQAFRRKDSPFESATFKLHGLDPAATYLVTDMDRPKKPVSMSGKALMDNGLPIKTSRTPQALLFIYRRK